MLNGADRFHPEMRHRSTVTFLTEELLKADVHGKDLVIRCAMTRRILDAGIPGWRARVLPHQRSGKAAAAQLWPRGQTG
jgi:hypothetical protein